MRCCMRWMLLLLQLLLAITCHSARAHMGAPWNLTSLADGTVGARRLLQSGSVSLSSQSQWSFPSAAYPSGLSSFPGVGVSRWTSCFPGEEGGAVRRVSIGIAADAGFVRLFPGREQALLFVSQTIATVNRVFARQIGVQLVVGEVLLMEEPGTWAWNLQPDPRAQKPAGVVGGGLCGMPISQLLDEFTAWRREERSGQQGLWHLFTNCFPPPGTVGLSWLGGLCRNDIGAGVSSFSSTFWLTVAHEIGHNLGSPHTFQLGQGKTGGIMDYADGTYELGSGDYQFAPQAKDSVCNTLSAAYKTSQQTQQPGVVASAADGRAFAPYCIDTSSPFQSVCGNGVVEGAEQCDDDSGCCDPRTCLLRAGKQCSPGFGGATNPCCQNCLFAPSTTRCNAPTQSAADDGQDAGAATMGNAEGYCANGVCTTSSCNDFWGQLRFCGVREDNPCRQSCSIISATPGAGSQCSDGFGTPDMNLRAGTMCRAYPHSTCQLRPGTGPGTDKLPYMECVESGADQGGDGGGGDGSGSGGSSFQWVSGPWSACLGSCGTGTLDRTVTCTDVRTALPAPDPSACKGSPPESSMPCELDPCPSYGWTQPTWSPCDTDCGTGLQHARPRCVNNGVSGSQPVVVDTSFCEDIPGLQRPEETRECVGEQGAICPLSWQLDSYAPCTETCGGGVEVAHARCVRTRNGLASPVSDSECLESQVALPAPLSRECNTAPCPAFFFKYTAWSLCSSACGGGTQTRTAKCFEASTGMPVQSVSATNMDAKCLDPVLNPLGMEVLERACATHECPRYEWAYTRPWSSCNAPCGGGEQYALVQCVDTSDAGVAGATATTTTTNGTIVADSHCTQTRPAAVATCNTAPCPDYRFRAGAWSACSSDCGGGEMSRDVSCYDVAAPGCSLSASDSSSSSSNCPVVEDRLCTERGAVRPSSTSECNQQSCVGAMWWAQDWGDCSAGCDGGWQSRQVDCVSTGTFAPLDDQSCGGNATMPPTEQRCNTHDCAAYQWVPGTWSVCSAVCDGGTRSRALSCLFGGTVVAASRCEESQVAGPAPPTTGACATQPCATFWWTSDFSSCDRACEAGTATRKVECRSSTTVEGVPVPDEACTATKPASVAVCNAFPCPSWAVSDWSACGAQCGSSPGAGAGAAVATQRRSVVCLSYENTILPNSACTHDMPATSQPCTAGSSSDAEAAPCPHWHANPWGECDRPCGGGHQNRTLSCRMPHDLRWGGQIAEDWTLCPAQVATAEIDGGSGGAGGSGSIVLREDSVGSGVPVQTQQCNTGACSSFYWTTDWGPCSARCGGGIQRSVATCVRSDDGAPVAPSMCLEELPVTQRPCATNPCAQYAWFNVTDWSACSVRCGTGIQSREVRCRDTTARPELGLPWELVDDSLCAQVGPRPPTARTCSYPAWQCYGLGLDPAVAQTLPPSFFRHAQLNGQCTPEGLCRCRRGWGPSGSDCDTPPALGDVSINGAQYSGSGGGGSGSSGGGSGIPLGEPLRLTWSSTRFMERVSLALVNERVGLMPTDERGFRAPQPFPQIFAANLLNNGSFVWRMGSALTYGLGRGGPGFKIRVLFSSQLYADSPEFSVAHPCGYVSCGRHGRCADNGVCSCYGGWSGPQCQLSPCESLHCNVEHGECAIDLLPPSLDRAAGGFLELSPGFGAFCSCRDGWSGARCATPPSCGALCAHGGDFAVSGITVTSPAGSEGQTQAQALQQGCPSLCSCPGGWDAGSQCAQCVLPCQNGFGPDASCQRCQCVTEAGSGFFGPECSCRYYLLSMRLAFTRTILSATGSLLYDVDEWVQDELVVSLLGRTLGRDFAAALGLDLSHIEVDIHALNHTGLEPGQVDATIRFAKACGVREFHSHYDSDPKAIALAQATSSSAAGQLPPSPQRPSRVYMELLRILQLHDASRRRLMQSEQVDPASPFFVSNSSSNGTDTGAGSGTGPSSPQDDTEEMGDNTALVNSTMSKPLATPDMDLASLYSILALHLSDLSSPLYSGLISSHIASTPSVRVRDPSGLDQPPPEDPLPAADPFALRVALARVYEHPNPMNHTLAIILGVVGGVALLTLIAAFVIRRQLRGRRVYLGKQPLPTEGSPSPPPPMVSPTLELGSPSPLPSPSPDVGAWANLIPSASHAFAHYAAAAGDKGRPIADSPGPQVDLTREASPDASPGAEFGGVFGGAHAVHVPLYARVGSASSSVAGTPQGGSLAGSAAPSGTSTPVTGSRRASDEPLQLRLQQLMPLQPQTPPVQLPLGMQSISVRRVNDGAPMNLPPGLPRGSFIQHVRVAQPAAAAPAGNASPSPISLSGSGPPVPSAVRMRNLDEPSQSPVVCASPSAPMDSEVLSRVFSPSP